MPHNALNGEIVTTQNLTVPGFGHTAGFANLSSGFQGSAIIDCNTDTIAIAVVQNQVNAFPTTVQACGFEGVGQRSP